MPTRSTRTARCRPGVAPWGLSFGLGMHACIGQDLAAGVDPMGGPVGEDHLYGLVPVAIRAAARRRGAPRSGRPADHGPREHPRLLGALPGRVPDVIDLHAHVVLEETLGAAGRSVPSWTRATTETGRLPCYRVGDYELVGVRYRDSAFMDVELRLRADGRAAASTSRSSRPTR